MLDYQIHEQGFNPRECSGYGKFRNFFRRAREEHTFHLHYLADGTVTFKERLYVPENDLFCEIATLTPMQIHGRVMEVYRLPTLTSFWLKTQSAQKEIVTASLPLHCCAFGYNCKLGNKSVSLTTQITAAQIRQGEVIWCSKARAWQWAKVHCHPFIGKPLGAPCHGPVFYHDLPQEAWGQLELPDELPATIFAVRPLKCNWCKIWFSDYETLIEHTCFHESNLGPFQCMSAERITVTINFELQVDKVEILVCEACMMFFCTLTCLLTHQQICSRNPQQGLMKGWRSSYGCIRPWLTLEHGVDFSSLLITGTPFRKLRAGCDDCLQVLQPAGMWMGAEVHAKQVQHTLTWTRWCLSLVLRRTYQNSQTRPLLRFLRDSGLLKKSFVVRDLLLEF